MVGRMQVIGMDRRVSGRWDNEFQDSLMDIGQKERGFWWWQLLSRSLEE